MAVNRACVGVALLGWCSVVSGVTAQELADKMDKGGLSIHVVLCTDSAVRIINMLLWSGTVG